MRPPVGRADASLRAVFVADPRRGAVPRVLLQRQPYRMFLPRPAPGEAATAVLANLSGGMVEGDRYDLRLSLAPGTPLTVTGQSAERIYRSLGAEVRSSVRITLGDGADLEWLPQGTIMFDGAALDQRVAIALEGQARLLAGNLVMLGRTAMGERFEHGSLRDHWDLRRDGRLVWADRFRLTGGIAATVGHPAGLDGAVAFASAVAVVPRAAAALELARSWLDAIPFAGRVAATRLGEVLLVRWLARDAAALRVAFGAFWAEARAAWLGRPKRLPAIWSI